MYQLKDTDRVDQKQDPAIYCLQQTHFKYKAHID